MRLTDFESLIHRLLTEVPPEFLVGVSGVEVSRATLPHPTRGEIWTLGECIPLPGTEEAGDEGIQSRVVLYHGSFLALARVQAGFDWRGEAWETLTHELRHHLEWRARAPDLEAFDWAAEQNFARSDGEPFDPLFHLSAERVVEGVYRLDEDFFLDRVVRSVPAEVDLEWHGRRYLVSVPPGLTLPAFLRIVGVSDSPPGELTLVLRRRGGLLALFRRRQPPWSGEAPARLRSPS